MTEKNKVVSIVRAIWDTEDNPAKACIIGCGIIAIGMTILVVVISQ